MRKVGIKRPDKLNLTSKKVAPPTVPHDKLCTTNRLSGAYSDQGTQRDSDNSLNCSYESFASEGNIHLSPSSAKCDNKVIHNLHLRPNLRTPSSLGSPGSENDRSPSKASSRNSMSSIDSGVASNQMSGAMSSFFGQASSSSLNSDKSQNSDKNRRFSHYQQNYVINSSSAVRESPSKSSVCSSSSSFGSSQFDEDMICSVDVSNLMAEGDIKFIVQQNLTT